MRASSRLTAEALNWKARRAFQGPQDRDHFIIEQIGNAIVFRIFPLKGLPETVEVKTPGEANRLRLKLSDQGYLGKVLGGAQ